MASKAAQSRAISIYQDSIARVSRRIGRQAAKRIAVITGNPAYDTPAIRDAVRQIILNGLIDADSSRPLPGIVNEMIVTTMEPLLPEGTTTIQFVEASTIAYKQLEAAITRALLTKKMVERESILAGAAVDLQASRVEETRASIIDGTASVWANGKQQTVSNRVGSKATDYYWERITEPGACKWCTSIAPRKTSIYEAFPRHNHDRCTRRLVRGSLGGI